MSKWTSKDAALNFQNAEAIEKMYIKRFQALYLTMVARASKLKNANVVQPSDNDMKNAIDGTEGFLRYDDLTSEDAAVYACLRGSADQNGKVDYAKLDGSIKDKEIDKKFIEEIKKTNDDGYNSALEKLSKIQDNAEAKAKKEIMEGDAIKFEDDELAIIENTMGKESSDAVKAVKSKYKNWKAVKDSGVMQAMGGSEYEAKFWSKDQQYKNWTELAGKTKDVIYKSVMGAQSNILTIPLKLFFFTLHEMLNPNSFFRRNVIGKLRSNYDKYKENKEAQKKLEELGYNTPSSEEGSQEQPKEETSKTYNKSIQQLQREVIKGWNLKEDLEYLGVKLNEQPQEQQQEQPNEEPKQEQQQQEQPKPEENPAADTSGAPSQENASTDLDKVLAFAKAGITASDLLNEAEPEAQPEQTQDFKEEDDAAAAGEDEKPEGEEQPKEDDIDKFRDTVANVVMRYNFMIYVFLRAFAGTYGTDENFRIFSFQPFLLKKNQKAEEKKEEEKPQEQKKEESNIQVTDQEQQKWDSLSDDAKKNIIEFVKKNQKGFELSDEDMSSENPLATIKKAYEKAKSDNDPLILSKFKPIFEAEKTPSFYDFVSRRLNEADNEQTNTDAQPSNANSTDTPANDSGENQQNAAEDQKTTEDDGSKDHKEFVLELTTGIDHWTKRDPVLARLVMRSPRYRVQLQKDAKFATYYAVANFMEEIFDEYKQYISALRNHKNFTKILNTDLRISGIKNLRIQQVIQHARECLNHLKNATNGFDSELNREWRSMEVMKKITNITQFLIIKKMNFENMLKFMDEMAPRLDQIKRPGNIISELSSEDASKIFGEKGLRFAFIDATKSEDETKAKKEAEKPTTQNKEEESPVQQQEAPAQGNENKAEGQ